MSPGKKTALLTGAGVVGLLVLVVAFCARDLAVALHVDILRKDPSTMIAWIPELEGSIKRTALRRYLRTPAGVHALRRRHTASVLGFLAKGHEAFLPRSLSENQIVQFGLYTIATGRWRLVDGPTTLTLKVPSASELLSHGPLLEFAGNGDFELDEYPEVHFTVWTQRESPGDGPLVVEVRMTRRGEP